MATADPAIAGRLARIKLLHTLAWALFAGCILAMPLLTWSGQVRNATVCAALVAAEVLILACNSWSCPLTAVAARYTSNRRDNFDIYLPEWLARHNKTIFGALYFLGLLYLCGAWFGAMR